MLEQHKKESKDKNRKSGIICAARTKKISEELDLRTESIITILLKIEKLSGKKLLKVLPPAHEVLKISFYSSNHKKIEK
jgi:hypothetical protein